jgi:glutaredoxin 3
MNVEIYVKYWCGYCKAAKQVLEQLGLTYREIEVEGQPEALEEMLSRSEGRTTVPQIFINGQGIGGYTDLAKLVRSGGFPVA